MASCFNCRWKRKHKIGKTLYAKCTITGSIGYRTDCPYYEPKSLLDRILFFIDKKKKNNNK